MVQMSLEILHNQFLAIFFLKYLKLLFFLTIDCSCFIIINGLNKTLASPTTNWKGHLF